MKSSINFRHEIERRVAKSGLVLPDATLDELVAYLEDLHAAALDDGASRRRSAAARDGRTRRIRILAASAPRVAASRSSSSRARRSRRAFGRWKEPQRDERDQAGGAPVPSASDIRPRHRAGAWPWNRRGDHGVHHCRFRGVAAAAIRESRRARHAVGHQPREGARARSDLAGELHGLPRAAGVQGRRRMVASRASTSSTPARIRCASTPSK